MSKLLDELEDAGVEVDDTLERLMDDEELYLEYLVKFPENENIIRLRKAVEEKNEKEAITEVHTLKGIGLNLGMLPLVDACMSMLLDLREGKIEEGFAELGEVEEAFLEMKTIIENN